MTRKRNRSSNFRHFFQGVLLLKGTDIGVIEMEGLMKDLFIYLFIIFKMEDII